MIEVALMVEGQMGLNWPRWRRIAELAEDLGFVGLYRSDHFTNPQPPDQDSLELWVSLAWLASHTRRIEFGPLVTPFSFRHPSHTARMAAAVDDLSGGRLTLGVGAGWQEREHRTFGFDLLDVPERFDRFEEGLQAISRLLRSAEPVSLQGEYYQLQEAILLPRPARPGGPPLLVGGNGRTRTLPLAARYADEWNAVFLTSAEFAELNIYLDELLEENGRPPQDVRRSMMVGCVFGKDVREIEDKVRQRSQGRYSVQELRQRGLVIGTPGQIIEQLVHLSETGLQRVMLQWLDLDDVQGLESLAKGVLTQLHN
jgi:F420-dependent oxidoreductase-like protein